MSEIDYIVSDGYDYAQTAMCFLWQYKGKKVDDVCYTEDDGREISVRLYIFVSVFINIHGNDFNLIDINDRAAFATYFYK